jgi:hypothetical protein
MDPIEKKDLLAKIAAAAAAGDWIAHSAAAIKYRLAVEAEEKAAEELRVEEAKERLRAARRAAEQVADADAVPPGAPSVAPHVDGGQPAAAGMHWKEVAERMEWLREQGGAYTSQHKLAETFGCSPATINRAIKETPSLRAWAKRPVAPRAEQSLDDEKAGAKEDVPQQREPDPVDDAADTELRELFEKADLDERAFLHEISGASRQVLNWYIEQSASRRKACRDWWVKNIGGDPSRRAWFLGLPAPVQLTVVDDPGGYPGALPRP